MAILNDKHGWIWTVEERRDRQLTLRRARNLLAHIREQARLTGQFLPQFQSQADEAMRHLADGLKQIVALDLSNRGRKYQPVSPEEFDRVLGAIPELLKPWERLTASPEYVEDVRQKNREIRAQNKIVAEHNRMVLAQEEVMWQATHEAFRLIDQGDIAGALDVAAEKRLL
jgi:hypothetical protein